MNTFVAFFRGINVGGKNILPMKALAKILEQMGCEEVQTYIQSGNVVFNTKENQKEKMSQAIRKRILETYGFEPQVFLLVGSELQEAIANNPFKTEVGKTLHFFFLESLPFQPDLEKLTAVQSKSEAFKLIHNVFYLYAPDGIGRSKLAANVEKCMGVPVTARNWNTVSKMMQMVNG